MSGGRRRKKPDKVVAQPARHEARTSAHDSAKKAVTPATAPIASTLFDSRTLGVALGLIAACVAVFASVRHNDFVYYDDPKYVTENPIVLSGLTARGIAWALKTGTDANWFPLTWFSHMLDVQLYGTNAGGHHITSLILHIASTLLLFGVLLWITRAPGRSAFVAGLFALHPLHVESVAWVAERKDVLSTFFWMLTLLAYAWYTRQPRVSRYALVLVLFAAGLMSKPMLVTLPFVLLLLDYWPLERSAMSFLQLAKEKVPMFLVAIASSIVTFMVQRQGGAVRGLDSFPLVSRIGNALVSYVDYIGKMLWPSRLAAFYPYPEELSGGKVIGAVVVLAGISIFAIRSARKHPYLIVGWLWYLGTLVPVIGLIQVGNQAMADRYTYVPLIGLFIVIAWGVNDLLERTTARRYVLPIAGTAALVACAVIARTQVRYWKDSNALWMHALRVTDENYLAHNNLGLALAGQGKIDAAIIQYNEALRIRPNYATARTNLGAALSKQGKTADAISNYNEVLRQKPDMAETHTDLGAALANQGKLEEAKAEYKEALRLKPGYPEAHANLGLVLARQGKVDEAIAEYNAALASKPGFVEVHNNLGYALAASGHLDEAITHYNEAIRLKPDFELARMNLAMTLANQGKTEDALQAFFEVLKLNPGNDVANAWVAQIDQERRKKAALKSR